MSHPERFARRLVTALLIGGALVASPVPRVALAADGELSQASARETGVEYVDESGELRETSGDVTVIDASTEELSAGWYLVSGEVAVDSRMVVSGEVHLILEDGCALTANRGIEVSGEANSLTIYGQRAGTGSLGATGGSFEAGIGSGNGADGDGNNITINGGVIVAQGGTYAAAIGGGAFSAMGKNIVINGGTVTATAGSRAAGIGTGFYDGAEEAETDVTINGGTVVAWGSTEGAGIGTGRSPVGPIVNAKVTINGGVITSTGGERAPGIGGGINSDCEVSITGGVVYATGGASGAGIGSGYYNLAGDVSPEPTISITGGTIVAEGGDRYTGSSGRYSGAGAAIGYSGSVIYSYGAYVSPRDGEEHETFSGCLVIKKSHSTGYEYVGEVYDEHTLPADMTWPEEDVTLNIPTGATLTIPDGESLPDNVKLTGEGSLSPKLDASISISSNLDKTYNGGAVALDPSGYAYAGNDVTPEIKIAWHADNNGTIGDELDMAPSDAGTYWVKVSASETHFYQAAEAKKQFTISPMQLSAPQEVAWNTTSPRTATWGSVENASSYSVQLYRDGVAVGDAIETTGTSYQFDITQDGAYTFTVTAKGSGNYADSPESEQSDSLTYYTVIVESGDGGSASATPTVATEGEQVSLSATPAEGYHFSSWEVTSGSITISNNTFTMPASSVTVTATFVEHTYKWESNDDGTHTGTCSCGEISVEVCTFDDGNTCTKCSYERVHIVKQPADISVVLGADASFSVNVQGTRVQDCVYQWQVSKDGGQSWKDVVGAKSSELTVPDVTIGMNGWQYRCVISLPDTTNIDSRDAAESDPLTLTSDAATLTVRKPPEPVDPGPSVPEDPENPDVPEDPEEPETPVEPEDPATPEDPEEPDAPVDPNDPGASEDPENPSEPGEPEGPSDSEGSEQPSTGSEQVGQQTIAGQQPGGGPTDNVVIPQTGDATPAGGAVALCGLGVTCVAAAAIVRRRSVGE